ncbi:endonuclease [Streptomyces sp. NPDC004647]|uniref:endonuclease I family protein n=1 Tax=Streptomyces sp. NPDC004647 TaxID=3154671 RepID=UPI0033AFE4D1
MPVPRVRRCKHLPLIAACAVLAGITAQAPATATPSPGPTAGTQSAAAAADSRYGSYDYSSYYGSYDDTYYKDAVGKTGPALKDALHSIIKEQTQLSYDDVWDALQTTDEDPDNPANVILLYTGRSQSKSAHGSGPDDWNREHVWAKSHGDFGTATGPGTDIHHLRPTDVSVNSTRGSKDFDNGGGEVEEAPGNRTDDDSFEPRDAVKGDVARMILYMAVRYSGDDSFADLEPNDQVNNGSKPFIGRLSVLKEWSTQDPPDTFEQKRNQVIYDRFQHNRNPFIDHPEWVEEIW